MQRINIYNFKIGKIGEKVGYLSRMIKKSWVFVPEKLGICPRKVGYLSPESWVFVPEKRLKCLISNKFYTPTNLTN